MLLQSTAALATLPLYDGWGDGSSTEETPRSPALRLLLRLSLRLRLAIWRFLFCALRHRLILVEDRLLRERRLGRNKVGAFQLQQQERTKVKPEKIFPRQKANRTCRDDGQLTNFSVPTLGSIRSIHDGGHE
jgi:hypothetical protein